MGRMLLQARSKDNNIDNDGNDDDEDDDNDGNRMRVETKPGRTKVEVKKEDGKKAKVRSTKPRSGLITVPYM